MPKIIYVHNENDKEVVSEVITNQRLTVWEALDLAGVDMEKYAEEKGWDGYDPEALTIEY